jgi:myo-inositol 2-dehydrogenase/D-chiro-inositol 1-dehydrogenase
MAAEVGCLKTFHCIHVISYSKLSINTQLQLNLVNIYEPSDHPPRNSLHYYGRFRHAFIAEANEFAACCLDDILPPTKLEGAVNAAGIGVAPKKAPIGGQKIDLISKEDGWRGHGCNCGKRGF